MCEQRHVIKDGFKGIAPACSMKIRYVPAPPSEFYCHQKNV